MKIYLIIILVISVISCRTIDMEKEIGDTETYFGESLNEGVSEERKVYLDVPREVVVVERPVYVPLNTVIPEQNEVKGQEAVRKSNAEGIIEPEEYSKAAMIYDYNEDWVYEVYTQPLRVSDIRLEAGETVAGTPFISDSERWVLGAAVSYERGTQVQHIYVKPAEASIEASLIINTDRRVYHVILKSFTNVYMPMIRWKYPVLSFPNNYASAAGNAPVSGNDGAAGESGGIDPRYISVNYRMRYGAFRRPVWLPDLVYDDGKKTYISFPKDVLQSSFPAVFDDRSNVVNYRVVEHVLVIDKLIQKVTVKLDEREIIIEKKRG